MAMAFYKQDGPGKYGILSGYKESGPKVESWEGESVGKQSSHRKEDC